MHESAQRDGVALPQPRVSEPFDRAGLDRRNEVWAEESCDLIGYSRGYERCTGAGQVDHQARCGHGVERRRRTVDRPILTRVGDEPVESPSGSSGGCEAIEVRRPRQPPRRESSRRVHVGHVRGQPAASVASVMVVRQR